MLYRDKKLAFTTIRDFMWITKDKDHPDDVVFSNNENHNFSNEIMNIVDQLRKYQFTSNDEETYKLFTEQRKALCKQWTMLP